VALIKDMIKVAAWTTRCLHTKRRPALLSGLHSRKNIWRNFKHFKHFRLSFQNFYLSTWTF